MKHFTFLLGSTFCIGVFAGVFVYFISDLDDTTFDFNFGGSAVEAFEITADMYGGCRLVCPSYRIEEDGSYLYLESNRTAGDERFEGEIDVDNIERELRRTPLAEVMDSTYSGRCPADLDGLAYRYEIRVDGNVYRFDTCRQDVSGYPLFELLKEQFKDFYQRH